VVVFFRTPVVAEKEKEVEEKVIDLVEADETEATHEAEGDGEEEDSAAPKENGVSEKNGKHEKETNGGEDALFYFVMRFYAMVTEVIM